MHISCTNQVSLSKWAMIIALVSIIHLTAAEEANVDSNAPVAGTVLGTLIRTKDVEELRYMVLGRLLEVFAKSKDISVTTEEIAAYQKAMEEAMLADRAEREASRDVLKRHLATKGLDKSERENLERELESVEQFLADVAPDKTQQSAEDKQAREQIASVFIKQWKINRALHQEYGGRLGYQQGGPEPLDATLKFLQERKERGDFTIATKELDNAFWSYYLNDSIHDFYRSGSKEEANAFVMPPWASKSETRLK